MKKRTDRLNSLLQEVLSEVIRKEVKNPHLHGLLTITRVDISADLRHAKVYVSVIAEKEDQIQSIRVLNEAAGFIAVKSSKLVVMRFFPELRFILDDSAEKHMRIEQILKEIADEDKEKS